MDPWRVCIWFGAFASLLYIASLHLPLSLPLYSIFFLSLSSQLKLSWIQKKKMGEEKKPQSAGVWPTVKPFVNGGASGMLATCVIQPIDMIKVMQIYSKADVGLCFYVVVWVKDWTLIC